MVFPFLLQACSRCGWPGIVIIVALMKLDVPPLWRGRFWRHRLLPPRLAREQAKNAWFRPRAFARAAVACEFLTRFSFHAALLLQLCDPTDWLNDRQRAGPLDGPVRDNTF
jgi:hypothetical protein